MATASQYGMFGPSPEEAAMARQAQIQEYARRDLNLTPMQQAQATFGEVGGMLGDAIGGAMGYENPSVARAKKIQQVTGQYDTSTSTGLFETARKFNEMGLTTEAQIAAQKGNELRKQEAAATLAARKQDFQENQMFDMKQEQMRGNLENRRLQLEQMATYQQGVLQNQAASIGQKTEAARTMALLKAAHDQTLLAIAQLKAETKDGQAPKNLTREARLKWELDNGRIDQATYDAAISASPGGVLRQKQTEAANAAETGFGAVERNIEQLYDSSTGKLKPATESLFGKFAQYRPEMTMGQDSVDAKLALEALTDQVMMSNLADAKSRVGQSFGSMQVQEWDRFTQQLASLKRGLSEEKAADAMKYVSDFIKNKRNVLRTAMSTNNPVQVDRSKPTQPGADKFVVGKQYKDSKGNVATYQGNGQWK